MRVLLAFLITLFCLNNAHSQQITGNPPLAGQILSLQNITCNNGSDGSLVVRASGGNIYPPGADYLYRWYKVNFPNDEDLGVTDSIIADLPAGQYYVEIKDCSDCPGVLSDTFTLDNPGRIPVEVIPVGVSCFGGDNGSATANIYATNTPYEFLWSDGQTSVTATGLVAGTYSVLITDGLGCSQTEDVYVSEPSTALEVNGTVQQQTGYAACNGSISLTVSGGVGDPAYTYLWSNDSTTQQIDNLCAGIYLVTVTDGVGCTKDTSFEITELSPPLAVTVAVLQDISCNGGNNGSLVAHAANGIPFTSGLPYFYTWYKIVGGSPVQLAGTDSIITDLDAGDYYVQIYDNDDGPGVISSTITLSDPAGIAYENYGTHVSCFGGNNGTATVNIYGDNGPFHTEWATGDTTATISNLIAGTYLFTLTYNNGCTKTDSVVVTQPAEPLSISGTVQQPSAYQVCDGAVNITVSGGVNGDPPISYSWSNGETTQNVSALCAGTFTVTVTDSYGCIKDTGFLLTYPNPPLAVTVAVLQDISCNGGSNGSLVAHATNGIPFTSGLPYFYTWYKIVGGSPVQLAGSDSIITGLDAGDYYVHISDNDDGPGVTSSTITLIDPPGIAYENYGTNVSCYGGNNGTATVMIYGDNGPFHTEWANGDTTSTISNLVAGTYTFTLTYNNGCTKTDSVIVTQPDSILLQLNTVNVLCNGGNTGSIDLTVSGGNGAYTYDWGAGQPTTQDRSGLIAGTYAVTVTDENGCSKSTSVNILDGDAIVLSTSQVNLLCNAGTNGSIDLTVSGGNGAYTYDWGAGQPTTQDRTGLAAGTYTVIVTDGNGCAKTTSVTITEPTAIVLSTTQVNVLCNAGTTGSIDLTVSSGTGSYTYNWGAGQPATQDRSGLSAGTYTVIVTDGNGCTTTTSVTITEPAPIVLSTTQVNVLCNGGNTGSIDLTVSGGSVSYTYNWGAGQPATQDRSGLTAGTYTVIVTDGNGCTKATSVTITEPSAIVLSTTQVNVLCNGASTGSIDLTVSGGNGAYTYNWGTGQPTSQDRTGLAAGTYTVIVTDGNGCSKSASVTISEPSAIVLSTTQVNVLCNGGSNGSIDLTLSGGTGTYTYNWGAGQPTSQDRTGLTAGTYTVIVTDGNGCIKTTSVTISEPSAIVLSTTQVNVLCNGGTTGSIDLTVSGGTGSYTYNWGSGQPTTQDRTGLIAGTYTVIVTDGNGCTKTTSVTITEPSAIVLSTTQVNVLCNGASTGSIDLSVSGGAGAYTYNWGAGQPTSQDRTGLAAGTYTVIVTDGNGCTKTTSVTISEPSAIVLSTTQVNVLCNGGNTGSIDLTVSGGSGTYTYNWGAGQPTTQDRTGLTAGTYTVIVTDGNGCTKTTSATITQPTLIVLSTIQVNVLCNGGTTGSIDLTVSGGAGTYTYNWGAGQPTTQDRIGLAAGIYTVIVTDGNGCTKTTSVTITEPSAIVLSTTQVNVLCNGASTGSIDLTVSGGAGAYTYNWGAGQPTTQDRTGLAAGTYTVIVTDGNDCTKTTSVTIAQPSAIVLSITQVNVLCNGGSNGSIDLTVSGGTGTYTYNWGVGQPATQDRTGLTAGTYTVIVTDGNGCTKTTSVTITQPLVLAVSTSSTTISCFGGNNGTATASASGGTGPYQYQWSTGAVTPSISNLTSGGYFVFVKDFNLCETQGQVIVVSNSNIVVTGTVSQNVCYQSCNGSITLSVTGGVGPYTYVWSNGSLSRDISGLCAGTYTVTVKDFNNCTSTKTFVLTSPAPVAINLGPNRTLCSGQTYTADAGIGVTGAVYQWTSTNGFTAATASVTLSQTGTYYAQVTTPAGCIGKDTIVITTTNGQISSEFIVSTQAFKGKTVTLVNISSPAPDSIQWLIPVNPNITVQSKGQTMCELVFNDTGTYFISMKAMAGQCEKTITKKVIVLEPQPFNTLGFVNDPLIKEFLISPVPNNGQFNVRVSLNATSKIRLRLINVLTNVKVSDIQNSGSNEYLIPYNLSVTPGMYVMVLETPLSSRVYKIIIN